MMYRLTAASLLLGLASAQTYTACNPLNSTCPADPALGTTLSLSGFSGAPSQFTAQSESISYSNGEAVFTINKEGEAPTLISNFYIFFGSIQVVMQSSPGQGIISSVVLESDDLDEIDLEWIGGNTGQVETNYFGKGDTTTYNRATYVAVSNPQTTYHNYTINWSQESVEWIIDGAVVRTLNYADAAGGTRYPQTPMKLRIGSWAGGDPKNPPGTIQWAGGDTNFADAPFVMNVKSITAIDASSGSSYEYSDNSGSWQSIKVNKGSDNGSSGSSYTGVSTSVGYSTSVSTSCTTTSTQITTYTPGSNPNPGIGYKGTSTLAPGVATPTTSTGPVAATGAATALGASSGLSLAGAAALAVLIAM